MRAITLAILLGTTAAGAGLSPAAAQDRPDQKAFFEVYKELVETNTTLSSGSCTQAAAQIGGRLKAAGYADADITYFSVPDHPKEGGVVAVLAGSDATAKPMLLLAHLDVVEADAKDWTRDPFKLIEEGGYYYARGTVDDKAMAAVWADTMIRLKQGGPRPRRTIKLALTCGEETTFAWNGAQYLAKERPDLVAAEFALNEGGGGRSDGHGRLVIANLHVGEKTAVNYRIESTNPGGHSSAPVSDNAIYELADALEKVRGYKFPVRMNATTRTFFAKAGAQRNDELGAAMVRLANAPGDTAAEAIVSRDRTYNSMLRTTCVATRWGRR